MRGARAKRLRAAARKAAGRTKGRLQRHDQTGVITWTGYRRLYQDSKRRAA